MNILVVGSGGREHAFISLLEKSRFGPMLYAAPGNGGISECAACLDVKETDAGGIVKAAIENSIDIAVVSSEAAVAAGVVDELEAHGIRAFGPRKNAAVIGVSGTFSKQLLRKYNIPSVDYGSFDNFAEAEAFVGNITKFPVVLKSDGLSRRFSVIASSKTEAVDALRTMASKKSSPSGGSRVTVEACNKDREFVIPVFTDGKAIVPMPAVLPYRRFSGDDAEKNTEGMGALCPLPLYSTDVAEKCMHDIFRPTVDALNAEGRTFRGILQFVLAFCDDGIKVVEYAPCVGDPEAETVLPLIESDLVDIMNSVIDGTLSGTDVRYSHRVCVSVVAAEKEHLDAFAFGHTLTGCDVFPRDAGIYLFHIGTEYRNGRLVTSGSRVFSVTAIADNVDSAVYKAYQNISRIKFEGMKYRHDIGKYRV